MCIRDRDLSDRARFRLTGGDRVRFLNGQVTNDVRTADGRGTLYACVTDIKGRIVADVFVHASQQGGALFLDAEQFLRDVLGPRLERYIIADDVEIADVTDEWRLCHVFGPAAGAFLDRTGREGILKSSRLGVEGVDVWVPASEPLSQADCPPLTAEEFEALRIIRGIPRFPNELNAETFPPEAGLDDRAMSYTKGCYIGQEILSRIRSSGRMPRELMQWKMKAGSRQEIATGDTLFLPQQTGEPKAVGKVTSAAWHPLLERFVGLAFLKQGTVVVDSVLPVGGDTPRIDAQVEISPNVKQ